MKSDLLIICGLILIIIGAVAVVPPESTNHATTVMHIVEPRETLWSIAEKYNPQKDPREVIWDMKAMNKGLNNYIYEGQILEVPIW